MDITNNIQSLVDKIPMLLDSINSEAAVCQYLVIPFIQSLGYDPSNPNEVIPQYDANTKDGLGASKKFKLDYAILKDNQPIILIECKNKNDALTNDGAYLQLATYFNFVNARIAILTNGTVYKFYTDLDKDNKMDDYPFLTIDLQHFKESDLEELKKFAKTTFDTDQVISTATELKFTGGIVKLLTKQMDSPDDEFMSFFFKLLSPGKIFTPNTKIQFAGYTKRAFKQFVRERINELLEIPPIGMGDNSTIVNEAEEVEVTKTKREIETLPEELEGFYLIKSILRDVVEPNRIIHNDTLSYFGVFLDNKKKPLCRLYFNNSKNWKIGLFDHGKEEKNEEKFSINNLNDIFQYGDRLKASVNYYQ